jgi:Xaa-Pro aminopeptidase
MHGICHHVGLAVHDLGGGELKPGMVFTVEPGAYLTDKGMGCRIEDVVLVTGEGCVVLSGALPAKPDDIEALMRRKGIGNAPVGLDPATSATK